MATKFQRAVLEFGIRRMSVLVACSYETVRRWTTDTLPDRYKHADRVAAALGWPVEEIYRELPDKKAVNE